MAVLPPGADADGELAVVDAILPVLRAPDVDATLAAAAAAAGALGHAGLAAACTFGPTGAIRRFAHIGVDAAAVARIGRQPEGHGLLSALALAEGPVRLAAASASPAWVGTPPGHPPLGPFLAAPVVGGREVRAGVYAARSHGDPPFTGSEERRLVALASALGAALDGHDRALQGTIDAEHRIARDLHDTVVQDLFATGLRLQATAKLTDDAVVRARILDSVATLDEVVTSLRRAILGISANAGAPRTLRSEVARAVGDLAEAHGLRQHLRFEGDLDGALDMAAEDHLLATLREALSNAGRHARATKVDVSVTRTDDQVVLVVADDGRGLPAEPGRRNGLTNIERRARDLGGVASTTSRRGRGTVVQWRVPIRPTP